jgi:hypothetical protein
LVDAIYEPIDRTELSVKFFLPAATGEAKLEQLAMNARGAPQRIVNTHPSDQRTQVRIDVRPASKGPGLPPPVPAETGPVPTHKGLRSNDRDGIEDRWKPSVQLDEEQAISVGEVNTTTHLPSQYDQLTSERGISLLQAGFST